MLPPKWVPPIPSPYVHHTLTLPSALPNTASTNIPALLHLSMVPLLPNPLPDALPMPTDEPYTVRKTEDRGYAMFANRPIPRGALIKLEHPIYILPALPLDEPSSYERLGEGIEDGDYAEMLTMANCRSKEECPSIIEGVARTNALTLGFHFPLGADSDHHLSKPLARQYGGVFLKINRCNHACGPNASYKWSLPTLTARLYALRSIAPNEEITINYTDLLQPRSDRLRNLEKYYKFACDCKWCTFTDPEAQEKSDAARAFLGTYLNTHPSYRKWSMDICLPDTFVIESHLSAIQLIEKEGLDALLPLFLDEILRCYAELGDEDQFRVYAERTRQLVAVADPELATELASYLEDPIGNFPKWGARRMFRENQAKQQRRAVEEEIEDFFMDSLFGPPISSSNKRPSLANSTCVSTQG
ncbi:SET domain-containing protein [Coprinopsis marcescibilis]|uniref:SET domain-containing protein n=1 Tax=Coprinopsis marcescibilis TaxID=230819 RepID=A0A5C3L0T3_COPMA|nr:SET domain-containing protein [Coprinopsis marcescibilis]